MKGIEVREFREKLGLDQYKFAKLIGVSQPTVCRAEQGSPGRLMAKLVEDKRSLGVRKLKQEVAAL
jgi:DNA-binding XRE family transcriptional regulator